MRYIKIKIDVDEKNYFFVKRDITNALNKLMDKNFYEIRTWKFKE